MYSASSSGIQELPQTGYIVTSMNIQASNPSVNTYSLASGVTVTPSARESMYIDCTIMLLDDAPKSINDFDTFLKQRPEWCSEVMLDYALRKTFPERYL